MISASYEVMHSCYFFYFYTFSITRHLTSRHLVGTASTARFSVYAPGSTPLPWRRGNASRYCHKITEDDLCNHLYNWMHLPTVCNYFGWQEKSKRRTAAQTMALRQNKIKLSLHWRRPVFHNPRPWICLATRLMFRQTELIYPPFRSTLEYCKGRCSNRPFLICMVMTRLASRLTLILNLRFAVYGNDITLCATSSKFEEQEQGLQSGLDTVQSFLEDVGITIFSRKD